MTARLCIATYGEDVSWVEKTGMEACIYDATGQREGLIPVRNKAREAGQYLHHIVENYGSFRDYEIFLQGYPFDHNPRILHWLEIRKWEGRPVAPMGRGRMAFNPNFPGLFSDHVLPFARSIGMRDRELGDWTVGAMFAVSRETLEARPLEWWKELQRKVRAGSGFTPWVMEQLWLAIFAAPYRPHRDAPPIQS